MQPLPIDPLLPEIAARLREHGSLVLSAEPGAGKTTRVPIALLEAGLAGAGEIWVSEPRRLAARLVARHVASERGERIGGRVGYRVRFEDVSGPETRLCYVTEGVLVRRLLTDHRLDGVGLVILDEFHERSLSTDLAFALVAALKRRERPDLGLVVMSATLDAAPVSAFLGGCPVIDSPGRAFPLEIEHHERPDDRPLEKQVVSAVRELVREEGDVLVFLPGAAEIRRAEENLSELARSESLLVLPLHGDQSVEEQSRAVEPASRRKVVLSTNVAETSVTIDGVTGVVDSGLARVARHSPWTGLPRLEVAKVSRSSATQRAGRAGRTRPGRVLRLYTRGDFEARPEHDAPEIRRADLSEALLTLHGAEFGGFGALAWLDAPPAAATTAAEGLLSTLGAVRDGRITKVGRRMLAFPLHPRLARVMVEAEGLGVGRRGALAAALLSERDIRRAARTAFGRRTNLDAARGDSDVIELMDRFDEARDARFDAQALARMGLDRRSVRAVDRARSQLERPLRDRAEDGPRDLVDEERRIRRALLSGFADRVARRARAGAADLVFSRGGGAKLSEDSVLHDALLMIAVDVEERAGRGGNVVRLASAIEADWLLDLDPDALEQSDDLVWNAESKRVDRVERLSFGALVLDESRTRARASEGASRVLARAALSSAEILSAGAGLDTLLRRIELAREHLPEAAFPALGPETRAEAVEAACAGITSLEELCVTPLSMGVLASLSNDQQRLLAAELPERARLGPGRSVEVHYEPGRPPWIESRLQDFFGSAAGPSLCRGRLPLTLHLLAPNQRAVQVTTDLEGFWQRHYPGIRRELMRRYPRHGWPEDGRHAEPPPPRPPRRPLK